MQPRSIRQFTLFEMPLIDLVKKSEGLQKAVLAAQPAEYTTREFPFMRALSKENWTQMRGLIMSELAAKFYEGYMARDLGCPVVSDHYCFGMVNEVPVGGQKAATSMKLRVILAKKELLESYDQLAATGPPLKPIADSRGVALSPLRWEEDASDGAPRVKLAVKYFMDRWEITLQNMADLHSDPDSASLREIELCVAGARLKAQMQFSMWTCPVICWHFFSMSDSSDVVGVYSKPCGTGHAGQQAGPPPDGSLPWR